MCTNMFVELSARFTHFVVHGSVMGNGKKRRLFMRKSNLESTAERNAAGPRTRVEMTTRTEKWERRRLTGTSALGWQVGTDELASKTIDEKM